MEILRPDAKTLERMLSEKVENFSLEADIDERLADAIANYWNDYTYSVNIDEIPREYMRMMKLAKKAGLTFKETKELWFKYYR